MIIEITTKTESIRIDDATEVRGFIEVSTPDDEKRYELIDVVKYEVIEDSVGIAP